MKQQRKNRTNQTVTWPTTAFFTIQELHNLNPKFVNITLRVRLTNAIEAGQVAEIGSVPGGKGRPQKVFTRTPVTQNTLAKARQDGINLVDNADKLVNVVSVTAIPANSTPTAPVTPLIAPTATVAS